MDNKKTKKENIFTRLFYFGEEYKGLTYLGMFLSGVSAIIVLMPIIFIWLGVKEIFSMYPNITMTETLKNYAHFSVYSALGGIFVYSVGLMCTHIAAFRIARNMRYEAISYLMDLPLGYFSEHGSGKIRRTINDSVSQTETYVAHQLPDFIGAILTPIGVFIIIFIFNWQLGLISMISLIAAYISMGFMMGPGMKDRLEEYQKALDGMNNEAVEYVRGISVVKTFGQSIFSFKKFHKTIEDYKTYVTQYALNCRVAMVLFQTFLGATSIFLVLGGIFLLTGVSEPKSLMLDFLFYLFFTPIYNVMMMKVMFSSQNTMLAEEALDRIDALFLEKPLEYKKETKVPTNFDIEFKDVDFSYPNANKNAISNISFEIKQGTTTALVGGSGGGKSTIATLIPRFFDVSKGSITIGGIDVRDMSEETLMNNISFVFQNVNLYKMSILDNVKEGNPNATEDEVINALKMARCEDIIAKLPNGIHTIYGTKGVYLSGGEAQRIAIARAILKDAPIILLDEATAFTDPENEHEIQLAMSKLAENKTVLLIAHRLSTVKNADCIYVVNDGGIVENGSHEKLIQLNGKYNAMWNEYITAFLWNEKEVNV